MFFEDNTIYSYGYHYAIAKIYKPNLYTDVVYINNDGYSPSTGKHTNRVRNAVTHMKSYYVPGSIMNDHNEVSKFLFDCIINELERVYSKNELFYYGNNLKDLINDYNEHGELFKIEGYRKFKLDQDTEDYLKEKQQDASKRQAKHRAEKDIRDEKNRIVREKKFAKSIEDWRNFKIDTIPGVYSSNIFGYITMPTIIRINRVKNLVETSRGASVPLSQAIMLLESIENGVPVKGFEIGHYTVNKLTKDTLTIGCHDIPLKEIFDVFEIDSVKFI